ncbi:MAG: ATP-binding protein [Roseburia sp.]|nr:ATP-binding protein [Roseburia sp.]
MKLLKLVIEGLPHFSNELNIDFVAQQRVATDNQDSLYPVFSKIYLNKTISFAGINASGKTTILKVVSFILKMLNNEPVNTISSKEIFNDLKVNQKVVIISYFYDDGIVYKLETCMEKEIHDVDESERMVICDESLWSKESRKVKTKKNMFDFEDSNLEIKRDQNEMYLMDDVSIIVAVNKKRDKSFFVRDMLVWTDHNMLSVMGKFPKELLTFLDPSIEYLECTKKEKELDIHLKFYSKDEIMINNLHTLEKYLSSGTIKGLGVFMSAVFAFSEGGYLIIDEIENHFNREIVATLIRFFMDAKVNKNGATLIYSTHYSELLNEFDRNDSIYIVRNIGGITAENLSHILKRNDMKKSEVYDSDFLGGTVPSYEAYMALKKVLLV